MLDTKSIRKTGPKKQQTRSPVKIFLQLMVRKGHSYSLRRYLGPQSSEVGPKTRHFNFLNAYDAIANNLGQKK